VCVCVCVGGFVCVRVCMRVHVCVCACVLLRSCVGGVRVLTVCVRLCVQLLWEHQSQVSNQDREMHRTATGGCKGMGAQEHEHHRYVRNSG